MLIHPTVERLRSLGLSAMADAVIELQTNAEAADLPHADWLGLLIDREVTCRDTRRLARRLQVAKLRQAASVENVDYRTPRGLDRALFQSLATSQWLREHHHVALTGPTGTGKSWLACALGHRACRDGFLVLSKRAPRLFADLAQARGEGRIARLMATMERTQLLILDDWGPEPLTTEQRRDLLEIVDDRYDKGSLLITSQVPIARWHDIVGDPTLGEAILDRVVHNAHRIEGREPAPPNARGELGMNPGACDRPRRPQAPPARTAPSLVAATARYARGPPMDGRDDQSAGLDRRHPLNDNTTASGRSRCLVARPVTTTTSRTITITGTGDHHRPKWPIILTGIRSR